MKQSKISENIKVNNVFKRRKKLKTDYNQRLRLLKSSKTRLVVRRSNKHIRVQMINFEITGDRTICEEFSKNLAKYGWKGHTASIPAAYLTGFMLGMKSKKEISEALLDIGLQISVKGNAVYAAAAGARDAGIKIPMGDIAPDEKRIKGEHIAQYAQKLKADDAAYKKQFSKYIEKGIEPEKLAEHFETVKKNIEKAFGD